MVVIQFFPVVLNESGETPPTDFMQVNPVPERVSGILQRSCYDCHSNHTRYPWYNKVQPVAWFLQGHIQEGKEELNFSDWGLYSQRRQRSKLKSVISQVDEGEMPLPSYTWIHTDAALSEPDKAILIDYISELRDSLQ